MGIFKIPKTLCDTINFTLAKYWWGQTKNEKKIHWINWKELCTPKKKGGMGFRDIQAFNLALQQNVFLVTNFSEEKYFVIENLHLVMKFEFRH